MRAIPIIGIVTAFHEVPDVATAAAMARKGVTGRNDLDEDQIRRLRRTRETVLPAGLTEADLLAGYPTMEQKVSALLLGAQVGTLFCVLFGVGPWAGVA